MKVWSTIPQKKQVRACLSYLLECSPAFTEIVFSRCDVFIQDSYCGSIMPWRIYLNVLPKSTADYDLLAASWHRWLAEDFPHQDRLLTEQEREIHQQIQQLSNIEFSGVLSLLNGFAKKGVKPEQDQAPDPNHPRCSPVEAKLQIQLLEQRLQSVAPSEADTEYVHPFERSLNQEDARVIFLVNLLEPEQQLANYSRCSCFEPRNDSKKSFLKSFRKTQKPKRDKETPIMEAMRFFL